MSRKPWFKFYSGDWRSDSALRMCSMGARQLWLEMLCIMDESDERGFLLINGNRPSVKQIALTAACDPKEAAGYLHELGEHGVFSRRQDGTIFSRKMVRESRNSEEQRRRRAGEPPIENADDLDLGGTGLTRARVPEARGQSPEPESRGQKPERGTRARRAATPLPDGFPDQEAVEAQAQRCANEGVQVNIGRELRKFREHAEANDIRWRDWNAAWRNWISKAIDWAKDDGNVVVHLEDHRDAPPSDLQQRQWRAWAREFAENRWSWRHERGPAPGEPGCRIPAEILAEHGLSPPAAASQ